MFIIGQQMRRGFFLWMCGQISENSISIADFFYSKPIFFLCYFKGNSMFVSYLIYSLKFDKLIMYLNIKL